MPTEFMLQFTFELLPILTNSIVPFVSINYIWIFSPFPPVCLVSKTEEFSSQALITAPALIYHLFPSCLKRCLTEFFLFKLASQNVSDFQKLLPLTMCWFEIWMFFPKLCATMEAGGHKRLNTRQHYPYSIDAWSFLSSTIKWQLLIKFWVYFF